jgi:hypothetical protein
VAAQSDERVMISERIAPGMLPRVLNSFDMLYASGVIGMLASAFGAYVMFRSPWTSLFSVGHWRIWLGVLCGISVLAALLIYAISEFMHRREAPTPTPTPA